MALKKFNYFEEETFNPFETRENSMQLKTNLDMIDARDIRCKFKNTQDPINYAFDTISRAPLKVLVRDFVEESFSDIISFITGICK